MHGSAGRPGGGAIDGSRVRELGVRRCSWSRIATMLFENTAENIFTCYGTPDHAASDTVLQIITLEALLWGAQVVATSTDHKVAGQVGQQAGAATWQTHSQPSMLHASAEKRKVLHKHLQLIRLCHNGRYCT